MLSVCIPVYNFLVEKLVSDISRQAKNINVQYEIILIDDFSDMKYRTVNRNLVSYDNLKYIELDQNIGRAKIRNLFLEYASFSFLLFLDCDVLINSPLFLKNYADIIGNDIKIACGGLTYNTKKPEINYRLRWKYGKKREVIPYDKRKANPYKSFNTINFLIRKDVFQKFRFDERMTGYGHEDTLFGFQLKMSNIAINHIDNPVINDSLESNEEFLIKTEQAVRNLMYIKEKILPNEDFDNEINLLRMYSKLEKLGVLKIISHLSYLFLKGIRKMMINGVFCISLFNFYKLGYYIQFAKKRS